MSCALLPLIKFKLKFKFKFNDALLLLPLPLLLTFPTPSHAAFLSSQMEAKVRRAAVRAHVDPRLALAIVEAESNYNHKAASPAGAEGLMQLMPRTAGSLGVPNSFHILSNAVAGCEYFRRLLTEFGSIELALAAYNAGPANVRKYRGIPPFEETRKYVKKVLALYKKNQK